MSRIAGRQRYSSPVMQERRRRILAEARALLAEAGEPGFNIRELSRRAGVSSRTLYHAFGGRDGILGHAIAEHIEALREEWAANPLGGDIDSILAEYDTVAVEIGRNSAYNRMLVALFFSVNPIGPALESIRSLPADRFGRWLDATPRRALLPRLDRERAIDRYVNGELSTYRYWASNRIALAALADELRINFLSNLLSITVGPLRTDIVRRYARLRKTRPHGEPARHLKQS